MSRRHAERRFQQWGRYSEHYDHIRGYEPPPGFWRAMYRYVPGAKPC